MQRLKNTITETVRLNRLRWFGHVQRIEENRISKKKMLFEFRNIKAESRPRNRWQDEVREDGILEGGRKGYITKGNGRSS
jgi:hypothetical protein